MSWVVFAGGLLLVVAGAVSVFSGAPYMRMEFGWTEVIAGTSAFAGGVVTMALGVVAHRLAALQKVWTSAPPTFPTMPRPDVSLALPSLPTLDELRPSEAAASSAVSADDPPVPAPTPAPATDPAPRAPLLAGLGSRFGLRKPPPVAPLPPEPKTEPMLAPLRSQSLDETAGLEVAEAATTSEAASDAAFADEPFRRVGIGDVAKDVAGRYEAGGASYILYSDGTIDVETSTGTHSFTSMDELKAFVERQDGEKATLGL